MKSKKIQYPKQQIAAVLPAPGWKAFEFFWLWREGTNEDLEDPSNSGCNELPVLGFAVIKWDSSTEEVEWDFNVRVIEDMGITVEPLVWDHDSEMGVSLSDYSSARHQSSVLILPPGEVPSEQERKDELAAAKIKAQEYRASRAKGKKS